MELRKLVRDRIPHIMRAEGKDPDISFANDGEYRALLSEKLQEEVGEFLESGSPEELADILEVVFALGDAMGVPRETLEHIRAKKFSERGGFSKRVILTKRGEK